MTKLTTRVDDWSDTMQPHEYIAKESSGVKYIYFLCPGCGHLIGAKSPGWELVDFDTLTVRNSILHSKPDGCGWHGYLTNGDLEGKIE